MEVWCDNLTFEFGGNGAMHACAHVNTVMTGLCFVSKWLLGHRFCVVAPISFCLVFEAGNKSTQIRRLVGILAYASNAGWG